MLREHFGVTDLGVKQGSVRDSMGAALLAQPARSWGRGAALSRHGLSRVCPRLFGLHFQNHP